MKRNKYFVYTALVLALMAGAALPQGRLQQTKKTRSPGSTVSKVALPGNLNAAATATVTGSGSQGQLVKWTGSDGSSVVGNSIITEDKFGRIGIGTSLPTSLLTVQGMIETTLGGYKFPDGTIQTTAASSSLFHNATLSGNGTQGSPLGVAAEGINTTHLANSAVTAAKIASATVLRSLNGLTDQVKIAAGRNITITSGANILTIEAADAVTGAAHNQTLTGDGTAAHPLGVAMPLILLGNSPVNNPPGIFVNNLGAGGDAIKAFAGPSDANSRGGVGLLVQGGEGRQNRGGLGLISEGGVGIDHDGGTGGQIFGGSSNGGSGGVGAFLQGGSAFNPGHRGGDGLIAIAGVGVDGAQQGLAGVFMGDVAISGNLSKGGGSFKIDHPLDPENKYLYHSFVESPDMMNIYNGTITTDANGSATVALPDWFEALNQDFRYQLTVIGTFAQAIVAEEIKGNRFVVRTNAPNVKVSWQVTGIRHDAYANRHRIPVEEPKAEDERGLLLHPEAFNQPEEKGIQFVKAAPHIENTKAARQQAKQPLQQQ